MGTSHNLEEAIVASVNYVVAVEVICCYRTCVETDEVVFAVTIAVKGDFHPNRAICHHRDFISMDSTQAQPQAAMFRELETDQKCGKCGLALHANVLYCPAANAQCLFCGKVGHYKRCCRLARLE